MSTAPLTANDKSAWIRDLVYLAFPEGEARERVLFDLVKQFAKMDPEDPEWLRYKLSVVLKDDNSGHMGSIELGVIVPHFDEDKLSNSTLILADLLQPLPTSQVGTGQFVIGGTKVRPSVTRTFSRDQNLCIYMQVYNLGQDAKTHKPSLDVEYELLKDGKPLLQQAEDPAKLKEASQQFTLEKQMPLRTLQPGKYTVQIKVKDNVKNQTISPSDSFEVQ